MKNEFLFAGIPADEINLIETISLEEIVKSVKEGIDINVEKIKSDEVVEAKYVQL